MKQKRLSFTLVIENEEETLIAYVCVIHVALLLTFTGNIVSDDFVSTETISISGLKLYILPEISRSTVGFFYFYVRSKIILLRRANILYVSIYSNLQ